MTSNQDSSIPRCQSDDHLRRITLATLDNLPYMVKTISIPDYRIIFLNQAGFRVLNALGVEVTRETIGQQVWDIFPLWKEAYFTTFEEVRTQKKVIRLKDFSYGVENCITYWDIALVPVVDKSGKVIAITSVHVDTTERKQIEMEREKLLAKLEERSKELHCLYQIASLGQETEIGIDQILARAVEILPHAAQYPHVTAARITVGGMDYRTPNFHETPWMISSDIIIGSRPAGKVIFAHLEEKPDSDEGTFLRDERFLIDSVADHLGTIIEHRLAAQRDREREQLKREFYRRIVEAATGGKLIISEREDIAEIAGKPLKTWELREPSDVTLIRHEVAEIVCAGGMEESRIDLFVVCIGEVITNAIKHAGGGTTSLHNIDDGYIFAVTDTGPGIEDLALPELALKKGYTTAASLGMGYKVMLAYADKVYLATDTAGTTVAILMKNHASKELPSSPVVSKAMSIDLAI